MSTKSRGNIIRRQILRDVAHHPTDIASHIGQIFSISRQAVNKHLKKLVDDDWLEASGTTRNRSYKLGARRKKVMQVALNKDISEHSIYFKEFSWIIEGLPKNIDDIVVYGFTEMLNNAIDHSEGKECFISFSRDKSEICIIISDDGEGIFKRITRLKDLSDEKQALLELHKGKLTTDPENHSGQGVFFTSRMFDNFAIFSHDLVFNHNHEIEIDYFSDEHGHQSQEGTTIVMSISVTSDRIDIGVFEQFTAGEDDDFSFNKTIIPVSMARFDKENLVSRSQAKRLLVRLENFEYVVFDFKNVNSIGQAFADEIFRVYRLRSPSINISHDNANTDVLKMIKRAESDL
ncbi:ATP-binding region, ATPase-like [hydrothermal vent metagenome]|uniref:ATP-binding region, ATPase-like n=1 Tax=hydrothermal vent metagenome TaxID=652676 RepID=A0A3B0WD63_9ZZZZ